MLFGEVFRVALEALRANRLRSLLTMLGIVIGVGAVITMVALGTGARRAVQDRIAALGPTLLNVFSGQDFRGGVAVSAPVRLTYDDALALAREARYVAGVAPELERSLQIEYGGRNINEDVIGTTPNFVTVRNYPLAAGRFFTEGENAARRRYAVLGATIPAQLWANGAAMLGQEIRIAGIPFTVIGVLGEKGGGPGSNDNDVLIPFETARYRVMGTDRLRTISVKASDVASMPLAMLEIERVLRREHKLAPGAENDFRIRNQREVLSTFEQTTQTFGYLLAGVAAVSLLVGGIGIMNIMLVSVTERTREIGIRMAIGARQQNILTQFLLEAIIISVVGCLIGLVVGIGGAVLVNAVTKSAVVISGSSVLVAFAVAAGIGIFFGFYPAHKASRLDPIEALRYQ